MSASALRPYRLLFNIVSNENYRVVHLNSNIILIRFTFIFRIGGFGCYAFDCSEHICLLYAVTAFPFIHNRPKGDNSNSRLFHIFFCRLLLL